MKKSVLRLGFLLIALAAICILNAGCSSKNSDKAPVKYVFKVRDTSQAYDLNTSLNFMVQSIIVRQYDEGKSYFIAPDDETAEAKFVKVRNDIRNNNWDDGFTIADQTYFTLQLIDGKRIIASEIITLK